MKFFRRKLPAEIHNIAMAGERDGSVSELICIANKRPSLLAGLIRLTNHKILCNFPTDKCTGKMSVVDVLWQNVFIFFISLELPVFFTHSLQEQI